MTLRTGAFGGHVATTGWDETLVCIGDVIRMGEAVVQVSQHALAAAAELPTLAERWRATLRKRVQSYAVEDWEPRLRMPSSGA